MNIVAKLGIKLSKEITGKFRLNMMMKKKKNKKKKRKKRIRMLLVKWMLDYKNL